jgi:4'-phosphopantetheinyl transferase
LSHCREAAICVLSDRPVGVDIESIREFRESLARYTMNESELHQILQSDTPAEAFIRLWTMKEATLKRSGEGIRNNMKDVLSGQHALETFVNKTRGYVYTVAY